MMEVNQNNSDRLWSYYQNQACEVKAGLSEQ